MTTLLHKFRSEASTILGSAPHTAARLTLDRAQPYFEPTHKNQRIPYRSLGRDTLLDALAMSPRKQRARKRMTCGLEKTLATVSGHRFRKWKIPQARCACLPPSIQWFNPFFIRSM